MSYTKLTDFAVKDSLLTGNPSKVVRGSEIDAEFNAIATADAQNLKTGQPATVSSLTASSISDSGNLAFTGTGNRITGDFSNATPSNRVMYQTSTANANTVLGAIPNGTGTTSQFAAYGSADPANSQVTRVDVRGGVESRIESTYAGVPSSGTYLPMTFYTGGSERMRIDTSGNVLVTNAGGLGYGTGAGGTVTQATSKATAVTLNKPTGQITMNAAALAASTGISFQVNNSLVTTSDTVIVSISGGAADFTTYAVQAWCGAVGSFYVGIRNLTAGSLSEAVRINFAIIKGATA